MHKQQRDLEKTQHASLGYCTQEKLKSQGLPRMTRTAGLKERN